MTTPKLRRLDTPLARQLAECILHQQDMAESLAAMKLWHTKYAGQPLNIEDQLIGRVLFRDAIIQFVGCFDRSAAEPLEENDIYGDDPPNLALFRWFKNMRDAYAAHKFGAQRQCIVGVAINKDGTIGVGHLYARYMAQPKTDGPHLISFMERAMMFINEKVEGLFAKLREEGSAMNRAQIEALPIASVHELSQDESRVSRSALQKLRSGASTNKSVEMSLDWDQKVVLTSNNPNSGTND